MASAQTNGKVPVISRETAVPIGLVVAVIGSLFWGTWTVRGSLAELDKSAELRFQALELRLEQLQAMVSERTDDRWRRHDMQDWAETLQSRNPTIAVPTITNKQ